MRLIAITLLLVVICSPFLHGTIPHEHGEHDSTHESSVWVSLHHAQKHEDKVLFLLLLAAILGGLFVWRSVSLFSANFAAPTRRNTFIPLRYSYALSRGIPAHRRFR